MKTFQRLLYAVALLACGFATINSALAQKIWTNGAPNQSWSSSLNWSPTGAPGIGDDVTFTNSPDAQTSPGIINNIVDAGFLNSINSLGYRNGFLPGLENYHTTGLTNSLSVIATTTNVAFVTDDGSPAVLFVGTGTNADPIIDINTYRNTAVFATMIGDGLTVSNRNANISIVGCSSNDAPNIEGRATLDLSGLNTFNCTVSNVHVGVNLAPTMNERPRGTLILAQTNFITASNLTLSDTFLNGTGRRSYLYLGQTNSINVDTMKIGLRKCPATLEFNTALNISNDGFNDGLSFPTASIGYPGYVTFRNSAGTGRQTSWQIGDMDGPAATSSPANGVVDFTGGIVDAQVGQITLGRGQANINNGDGNGFLTFGAGTINANSMQMGIQIWTNSASSGRGTLTLNNDGFGPPASLTINSNLDTAVILAGNLDTNTTVGTATSFSSADIILNGGSTLAVGGDITKGGGRSTLTLNDGSKLDMAADATPGNLEFDTIIINDGIITNFGRFSVQDLALNFNHGITNLTIGPGQSINPVGVGKRGLFFMELLNPPPGGFYVDLVLRGTTEIDINKTGASCTADILGVLGIVDMGGTLKMTATGDPLAAGDSFQIVSCYVFSNTFAAYDLPPLAPGLTWENDIYVDFTMKVVAVPRPTITVSNTPTTMTLSWPLSFTTYTLRGQTNAPGAGITTNWFPVPGVVSNSVTVPIDKTKGSSFYQLKSP